MKNPRRKSRVLRHLQPVTVAVIVVLCLQATAFACPTCKDSLAEGQVNLVRGYFWSILFMMSMPFLIFAGLSGYFYLLVRRSRARATASEKETAGAQAPVASTTLVGRQAAT
jgi:hypothetical protein